MRARGFRVESVDRVAIASFGQTAKSEVREEYCAAQSVASVLLFIGEVPTCPSTVIHGMNTTMGKRPNGEGSERTAAGGTPVLHGPCDGER